MSAPTSGQPGSGYLWGLVAAMAIGFGVVRLLWTFVEPSASGAVVGAAVLALGILVLLWRRYRRPHPHASQTPDASTTGRRQS